MASDASATGHGVDVRLLGIHLNDHLAGAVGGVELARRAAGGSPDAEVAAVFRRLATEASADRFALRELMHTLGVPERAYKVYAGWVGEKLGRLKVNGRLRERSPVSGLVELDGLRLVVEAKAALWATLRVLADHDPRLDAHQLDGLLDRARDQAATLEGVRARVAAGLLT